MAKYLDNRPMPWTSEDVDAAILDDFQDAKASIEEMPGGRLWGAILDLTDTCWILEASCRELFDEICLFADHSKNPGFWDSTNESSAEMFSRRVKKRVFQCTSAVMALVDHARVFQSKYPIEDFSDRRRSHFGTNGLHAFLQGLRNYSTHRRIASADWQISYDFEKQSRTSMFLLKKDDLLAWDGWTKAAAEYIAGSVNAIDVESVFKDYNEKVGSFYVWHKWAVIERYSENLKAYFQCKMFYDRHMGRAAWNLRISHAPSNRNLYEYLDRHLSTEQVEHVLSFDYKSESQIRRICEIVDLIGAGDEVLIDKVIGKLRE